MILATASRSTGASPWLSQHRILNLSTQLFYNYFLNYVHKAKKRVELLHQQIIRSY